jgi:hypothetical protein
MAKSLKKMAPAHVVETGLTHIRDLTPDPANRRSHNPRNIGMVVDALQQVGAARSIVIDEDGVILAGNGVSEAAAEAGITKVQVVDVDGSTLVAVRRRGLTAEQKRALAMFDNRTGELAEWNAEQLRADVEAGLDLKPWFGEQELAALLAADGEPATGDPRKLADRFLVPPFSVLNAREGWWQERKAAWLALGIQSEIGRAALAGGAEMPAANYAEAKAAGGSTRGQGTMAGTSIFDPVLSELAYRWFCPPVGLVLDPFAGGSVRGIVASKLGRQYIGIDLRPEQLAANREQAARICDDPQPVWVQGDSVNLETLLPDVTADFVFSCPPYADLEVYSDDPRDLSAMEWEGFIDAYRRIITASLTRLKDDRFACFVIGDVRVRDKRGMYRGLPWQTVAAFEAAGAPLYNEAVLVTAAGSLPIRAASAFEGSRKLGKTHQNVLVFCKGDPKVATQAIGLVECGEIPA